VKSRESRPLADLRRDMLENVKQSAKPYGIVVRKLDYPFSDPVESIRRWPRPTRQGGGSARPVSPPLLAYRVYPDGHEELVRGLRFHGLSTRTLRDIMGRIVGNRTVRFREHPRLRWLYWDRRVSGGKLPSYRRAAF